MMDKNCQKMETTTEKEEEIPLKYLKIIKAREAGLTNAEIGRAIGYNPEHVSRLYHTKISKYNLTQLRDIKKAYKSHDMILSRFLKDKDGSKSNMPAVTRAIDRVIERAFPVKTVETAPPQITFTQINISPPSAKITQQNQQVIDLPNPTSQLPKEPQV